MIAAFRLAYAVVMVALACFLILVLASFDAVAKKVAPVKKCQPWRETCNTEWKT